MGLAVVLHTSEYLFLTIKLLGAAYLFYIAWQLWRAPVAAASVSAERQAGTLRLARQEFLVAAGNPKAILIFTAFRAVCLAGRFVPGPGVAGDCDLCLAWRLSAALVQPAGATALVQPGQCNPARLRRARPVGGAPGLVWRLVLIEKGSEAVGLMS
ncbi:leucine export protein LeuE [compost metagenome]